jgi:hypothetical protein
MVAIAIVNTENTENSKVESVLIRALRDKYNS